MSIDYITSKSYLQRQAKSLITINKFCNFFIKRSVRLSKIVTFFIYNAIIDQIFIYSKIFICVKAHKDPVSRSILESNASEIELSCVSCFIDIAEEMGMSQVELLGLKISKMWEETLDMQHYDRLTTSFSDSAYSYSLNQEVLYLLRSVIISNPDIFGDITNYIKE